MDLTGLIRRTSNEKHVDYLRMAYEQAWRNSDDTSTKTGAVIVNGKTGELLSWGFNHYPYGLDPTPEQLADRDFKLAKIIHAEPSSVHYAAKMGKATNGATMYMPWIPCEPCAEVMVDSGIKIFIGHEAMIDKTPTNWGVSTYDGLVLLKKAGVKSYMYTGPIGGVEALFRGEEWKP